MAKLPGRRGQAVRNDAIILEAARNVFLDDPGAPIAAVAQLAGVGFSAVYRRYPSKEHLLRQLCHDGLKTFIAEAEAGLADDDGWHGLTSFLARVVDADVHSLTVRLAGTFIPTPDMNDDAKRANELTVRLVERAREQGRLRPDIVADDLEFLLEGCSAIRLPDPGRTRELRRRFLSLLLKGLSSDDSQPLPGPPPEPQELNWRWAQRSRRHSPATPDQPAQPGGPVPRQAGTAKP